jgi:hypothetical protein
MKNIILILFVLSGQWAVAGDLDDGIKMDEAINDDLKLDTNIQFIKAQAKAASQAKADGKTITSNVIVNDECGGTGNQVFGVGTDLSNAVIVNISDNRGSSTACVK